MPLATVVKNLFRVTHTKAYFSESNKKNSSHSIFNEDQVIKLLEFIVDNSYYILLIIVIIY